MSGYAPDLDVYRTAAADPDPSVLPRRSTQWRRCWPKVTSVEVSFRRGRGCMLTGETFQGDQTLTVAAPLDTPRRSCCRGPGEEQIVEDLADRVARSVSAVNTLVPCPGPTCDARRRRRHRAVGGAYLRPRLPGPHPPKPSPRTHRDRTHRGPIPRAHGTAGAVPGRRRPAEVSGYVMLTRDPPPIETTWADPLELRRIYVDEAEHGKGTASALMQSKRGGGRT